MKKISLFMLGIIAMFGFMLSTNAGTLPEIKLYYDAELTKPVGNTIDVNVFEGTSITVYLKTTENLDILEYQTGFRHPDYITLEDDFDYAIETDYLRNKVTITYGESAVGKTNEIAFYVSNNTTLDQVGEKVITLNVINIETTKIITNNDEDVSFESDTSFPATYVLVVTKSEKDKEDVDAINEKVKDSIFEIVSLDKKVIKDVKVLNLYDINVNDGTSDINMENGQYTISLPIAEEDQVYDNYKIIFVNDDNEVEVINAKLVNNKIVFITTHLSTYGIVGYNATAAANSPKTSDGTIISFVVGFISLIGLVGVELYSKKKSFN